jgi:hypothetical protein
MKKLKRKYKFQGGIQRIQNDTPDYSEAYDFKAEQNAKMQAGKNIAKTGLDIAGTAIGVPGLGGMAEGLDQVANAAFKDAKGNYKSKTAEVLNNQLNPLEKIGKGFSAITGDKAAAADLWSGSLGGTFLQKTGIMKKNPFGKTSEEIGKEKTEKAEETNRMANINKRYSEGTATDAQAALAKKGKYKLKTKQPRLIETEGREPIFSPQKADGTRDLLYYNPNDPTHEEGGVKAVVMPKKKYTNGTSNLMPKRPASKYSLVGNGNMAVGAKQLKVNDLNDIAFSQNLSNTPSANAANAFFQPQAGINQVARQIPQERRQEKINTKRSHKKSVGPVKTVEPPMLYEMKPPPPRSTFNTKNDFIDGTKKLKVNKFKKAINAREQSRKEDSTRYAQNVYSTALNMANKNMNHLVTEKRPNHKNYGKKTGNNTCLTTACAINKMTGTNLPFDLTKARNADPRIGDNRIETRYNPAFLKNPEALGYKLLSDNDKMQPGDLMQVNKSGRPTHSTIFLGNKNGPMIAQDHGDDQDGFGVEVTDRHWEHKYKTVKDAKKNKDYGWVYRYMGLPKKEIGSKNIKVYKEGTDGTEPGATYKHTKTFKSKPAYQAALQSHDDSLNLYSQSRYFTDLVKNSGLYQSTVENPEVKNITRSGLGRAPSPLKAYGSPNDASEEIMSVAGINPMRKDLYSRKESQYKSFKEHKEAEASGQPHGTHEGYEINMYKHPEMAVNYVPDTAQTIQPKRAKFKTSSDSTTNRTPVRQIQTPTKETIVDTSKIKTTPIVATKPTATRGKFVGRKKTLLDKAGEFLNKVGSSKRMSNGKSVRVFK